MKFDGLLQFTPVIKDELAKWGARHDVEPVSPLSNYPNFDPLVIAFTDYYSCNTIALAPNMTPDIRNQPTPFWLLSARRSAHTPAVLSECSDKQPVILTCE